MSRFHFKVKDSFANGPCCANILTLTMTLAGGATMTVDCVIIYTVNGDGLITSIRAHWEPDRAIATLLQAFFKQQALCFKIIRQCRRHNKIFFRNSERSCDLRFYHRITTSGIFPWKIS